MILQMEYRQLTTDGVIIKCYSVDCVLLVAKTRQSEHPLVSSVPTSAKKQLLPKTQNECSSSEPKLLPGIFVE